MNNTKKITFFEGQKNEVTIDFTVKLSTRCWCGLNVEIGTVPGMPGAEAVAGTPLPCALHEEPRCRDYERLDLVEYIRWLRTPQPRAESAMVN